MKVTWNWLAEVVDLNLPLERLAERLTLAGLEVESIEQCGRELAGVRCAEVVRVTPHPGAERLSVCDVRTGGDAIATVVCGAPNVRAGARVCYAPPGATLPGGRHIEVTVIRDVTSAGMLCSEAELEVGPDTGGILILPPDAPIGERVGAVLGVEDVALDIAVTPNRGDCLSVLGLAREIAALTGQRLRRQRIAVREGRDAAADRIAIRIADDDLCARYVGRVISGVRIAPSPLWMQSRLRAVGLRPINNVVDVTNYVMVERGQPLHAFDYDRLPRPEIVVRRAGADTTFTTLDGQTHTLHPDDLVIASGAAPVALAGVMGGANTEITSGTQRILLESAWFAPGSVRRTSKRLGLHSESSYRFERQTDIEGVPLAADRAAALIAELAGGTVARGRVDVYSAVRPTAPIALRLKRVDELLGMTLTRGDVIGKLKALGMAVTPATPGTVTVVPPSYRADLAREIDLIEEIVRLVGYENVPTTLPECGLGGSTAAVDHQRTHDLKNLLAALGLSEAVLLSFCSARDNATFPAWDGPRTPVVIRNPLTQDDAELRLSLCAGLARAVRHNLDQGAAAVALFSAGKVFWRGADFAETWRLAGAICPSLPQRGLGRRGAVAEFADVKGIVDALLCFLAIGDARWTPLTDHPAFHPGKTARIELSRGPAGIAGALHPAAQEGLGIRDTCWLFELDLPYLFAYCPARSTFEELPRFPAVVRDVAIVAVDTFASDQVIRFVREWSAASPWIEHVELFDQYVGSPIPAGKKSLAYSISYRAPDRTLTDAEVNDIHARLVAAIQRAFQVELR
jgi:phenylalanyl-tRNA synthetase beta chain